MDPPTVRCKLDTDSESSLGSMTIRKLMKENLSFEFFSLPIIWMTNVDILAKTWGQKTAGSGTFYAKFIHHLKLCYVSFTVWSFHTKKKIKN